MKLLKSALIVAAASVAATVALTSFESDNLADMQAANHWGTPVGSKSYILQGANASRLNDVVSNVGGDVRREFPIINAVSAMLTPGQADSIREIGGIRIQDDRTVMTMNNGNGNGLLTAPGQLKKQFINNYIAEQTGANLVHDMGITGDGVTVAVVDSGANMGGSIGQYLFRDTAGKQRVAVKYDSIRGRKTYYYNDDYNGHGTHVSGIIASSLQDEEGNYNGIAPDVYLLSVRAFDENGESSYSKVLDALNWVFENRYKYKIRVVNMSLGAEVRSHYWEDPINQAVMRLWDAGVVVVTSAGNNGEDMGISVPGNNPYVITVGAVTDNYTPTDFSDDRVTTFSSKGPTYERFIKPEVVAYGARIATKMDARYFAKQLKESDTGLDYSEISGTSQASAVVAGIAALVISNDPYITPDEVKCRIAASAQVAHNTDMLSFSPFQQGAGMANAYAAVLSKATNCANVSLNIKEDLLNINHFMGPARVTASGEFYIELANGAVLTEGTHWGEGALGLEGTHWGEGALGLEGTHWGEGALGLEGTHWGEGALGLEGTHWGEGAIGLEGTHWGEGALGLEGTHWGEGALGLEGTHWGEGALGLESVDLDLEPIDPSVQIPIETDGWQ